MIHKILGCIVFACTIWTSLVASAPFAVHFDVEPASLPEWTSDFQGIANQYLDLLQSISANKGTLLDLVADTSISFNLLNVTRSGVTKPLYQWVLDYVDFAMLMCYRNYVGTPNGLTALATPSVDYATQIGKKAVIVGVETNDENPAYITFYGSNTTYLETILGQVDTTFKGQYGFAGIAVHDYTGYQGIRNTQSGQQCVSKGLFEWDYKVATNSTALNLYFQFARDHCVSTTYLESEYLVRNDNHSLGVFWNTSQGYNMNMHFLFGDAEWAYATSHTYVLTLVQAARNFVEGINANPHTTVAPTSTSGASTGSTSGSVSTSTSTSRSTSAHTSTSTSKSTSTTTPTTSAAASTTKSTSTAASSTVPATSASSTVSSHSSTSSGHTASTSTSPTSSKSSSISSVTNPPTSSTTSFLSSPAARASYSIAYVMFFVPIVVLLVSY